VGKSEFFLHDVACCFCVSSEAVPALYLAWQRSLERVPLTAHRAISPLKKMPGAALCLLSNILRRASCYTGITSLHLSSWYTKQLPASLGQLANLRSLSITHSSIDTLPDSISGLTALTGLRLERCGVASLPSSLGQLAQLKTL
jgi:Leucine-rich repeat (LRR) protein